MRSILKFQLPSFTLGNAKERLIPTMVQVHASTREWLCVGIVCCSCVLSVFSDDTFMSQEVRRTGSRSVTATDLVSRINKKTAWTNQYTRLIGDDILVPRPISSSSYQGYSAAIRRTVLLWPGGVIPYKMDVSILRRPNHVRVVKAAMAEWERRTCIRFVDKTNQPIREFVGIHYGQGCRGSVGRWRDKRSILSLGKWCDNFMVVLHELGHTIGFKHEQNRPDRDKYVTIVWRNIIQQWQWAFSRQSPRRIDSRGVPYDYQSIMHYGPKMFSKNGKATIVPRDPSIKYLGNTGLSMLDVKQTNILYSCVDYPKFPEDFFFRIGHRSALPNCFALTEPQDPTWPLTNMCYREDKRGINIRWSHSGPVPNMTCTNTYMSDRKQYSRFWRDNYLCVPRKSVLKFGWSESAPIVGMNCTGIRKHAGSAQLYYLCAKRVDNRNNGAGNDRNNYLNWSPWQPCDKACGGGRQTRVRTCKRGRLNKTRETRVCNMQRCMDWPAWPNDFRYHVGPSLPDQSCVRIYERSQYADWLNHMLCWRLDRRRRLNLRWSDAGRISGMRCTQITEPREPRGSGWNNNHLCVHSNAPYRFRWSWNGPIQGLQCLKWNGKLLANGWNNNYLCAERYPKPSACPAGWHVLRSKSVTHCYHRVETPASWQEAQRWCRQNFNSNLQSIISPEELQFIQTTVQGRSNVWTGLNDRNKEGTWQWPDGTRVTFTNWSHREPNNGGFRRNEDCAVMRGDNNKWADFPCQTKFAFICKKSVKPLKRF